MKEKLMSMGYSARRLEEASSFPDFFPGRVIAQYRDLYRVALEKADLLAELSGKFRHLCEKNSDYPAVGDFVLVDRDDELHGNAIIHEVLPRKSAFIRKAAGTSQDVQVVAANVDTIFICMSVNNDFNLRRAERYLSIAWDSGATPVIVITKADLCNDLAEKLSELEEIAIGVDIIVTSGLEEEGLGNLMQCIAPGKTVAFIGSSGVGKSTLINKLLGRELIETQGIRKDDKGRHTTTRRELIILPQGGAVIDTPGMREIGVESANLTKTFADIEELADQCRFKDCQHENEPGCMVKKAVEDGLITEERLQSYKKLKKEAKYEGLNSKEIEKEKINTMFADFGGIKNARNFIKSKKK